VHSLAITPLPVTDFRLVLAMPGDILLVLEHCELDLPGFKNLEGLAANAKRFENGRVLHYSKAAAHVALDSCFRDTALGQGYLSR
jgi:hypothetical protein